jgi:hypothetical protein
LIVILIEKDIFIFLFCILVFLLIMECLRLLEILSANLYQIYYTHCNNSVLNHNFI